MALQPARQVNSARHLPAATPTTHTALKPTAVARCHSPSATCRVLAQRPVLCAIELHAGPWPLPAVHGCPSPHMLCPFLRPSLPALCNLHCQPNRLAIANAARNNTLLLLLTFACFVRLHLWLKRMRRPHRHRHPRSAAIHRCSSLRTSPSAPALHKGTDAMRSSINTSERCTRCRVSQSFLCVVWWASTSALRYSPANPLAGYNTACTGGVAVDHFNSQHPTLC
ncbi:hypothetical protein GQ54DRAFT_76793 [Martensiomyces pterosporus]|nr:hypothetical protein GQ54DRAFT_76793 [Martensiomyces pterosporus]